MGVELRKEGIWKIEGETISKNILINSLKDKDLEHTTYNIADFNLSEKTIEGEVYTVSAQVITSQEKVSVKFYHSGGNIGMGDTWLPVNEQNFYYRTFTATAQMENRTQGIGNGYCRVYVSNNPSGSGQSSYALAGTAHVNWIKLEKGSIATPWVPNEQDEIYTSSAASLTENTIKNQTVIGQDYINANQLYQI